MAGPGVRTLIVLALFFLLLSSGPAQAGQWQFSQSATITNVTNGTTATPITQTQGPTTNSVSMAGGGTSVAGFCAPSQSITISGSETAQVTWTAQWVPAAGQNMTTDPPPALLSVRETPSASYSAGSNDGSVSGTGTANDGFGDAAVSTGPGQAQSQGGHLVEKAGSTGTASWTETLTASYGLMLTAPSNMGVGYHGSCGTGETITLSSASLTGDSTLDTANWDRSHPRFFSGTNCSATAAAVAVSGYVKQAQLLITDTNGTDVVVKQYYDISAVPSPVPANTSTGTNQSSTSLTCHFDSTHFGNTANIVVKMIVWDTAGNSYRTQINSASYNKAYLLNNTALTTLYNPSDPNSLTDGGEAVTYVSTDTALSNVAPTSSTSGKTLIASSLPAYSVFYAWTHSYYDNSTSVSYFGDGSAHTLDYYNGNWTDHYLGSFEVLQSPNPKTVNQPPYNLVFMDACQTGVHTDMVSAFLGPQPQFGYVYQAFFGWLTDVIDLPHNVNWTSRVFQYLENGENLSKAIDDATGTSQDTWPWQAYDPVSGVATKATNTIVGDSTATLHGVYHGTGSSQWYL